jgi:lysozyme family protein
MGQTESLQREIAASIETLERRLVSSADAREKRAIAATLIVLSAEQSRLRQSDLLGRLQSLSLARDELEKAVGAAQRGPFDGYLCALEHHIERLDRISGRFHAKLALPKANLRRTRASRGAFARRAMSRRLPGHPLFPIVSTDFADLRKEYARCYSKCTPRTECRATVDYYVRRLRAGQQNYELVQAALGVPWAFVGVIHAMECGFNFSCHLHNGDPLTARTTHVPRGRPVEGSPPFTWQQSAVDALQLRKLDAVTDWSVPHQLFLLEGYNGFGYRRHGVPTPYLWSFSNLYSQGKFTQDGKFDPAAVSRQCGAALMLKEVLKK